MNADAFRAVADVIEYFDRFDLRDVAANPATDGIVWDGQEVWDDCGTVACVWGWTNTWADQPLDDVLAARRELGITAAQADRLFYAFAGSVWAAEAEHYGWPLGALPGLADWSEVTAAQAADMLRRIADGEVTL